MCSKSGINDFTRLSVRFIEQTMNRHRPYQRDIDGHDKKRFVIQWQATDSRQDGCKHPLLIIGIFYNRHIVAFKTGKQSFFIPAGHQKHIDVVLRKHRNNAIHHRFPTQAQ